MSDEEVGSAPEGEMDDDQVSDGQEDSEEAPSIPMALPEGVKKEVLQVGEGDKSPKAGDEVEVHYVGTLASDGSLFDSSRDRGQPFTFMLGKGQVIKGWDLGVATMLKGEKSVFTLQPEFAYGEQGSPPKIPANATLKFEVELISWVAKDDLFGDGGVIKSLVKKGTSWKKPKDGGEVRLSVKAIALADDKTIEEKNDTDYVIGSGAFGALGKTVDKALVGMGRGDECSLRCAPNYIYKDSEHGEVNIELRLHELYTVSDVSVLEDKTVMKKTIQEGEGYDMPKDGCKVTLKVDSVTDRAGVPLPGFSGPKELPFESCAGEVCDVLECAVKGMKKGERAVVTCTAPSKAVEAKLGLGEVKVAEAVFTVELVDFVQAADLWKLSDDEKVNLARKRKHDGGVLFSAKRFELALEKYKRACDAVDSHDTFSNSDLKASAGEVKRTAELNKAACFLKVGNPKGALDSCDKVLKDDKTNVKALFRRAKARHLRSDHSDALLDLRKVMELDPKNAEVKPLLQQVRRAQKLIDQKSKNTYAKMCQVLGKLGADKRTAAAKTQAEPELNDDAEEDFEDEQMNQPEEAATAKESAETLPTESPEALSKEATPAEESTETPSKE